MANSPPASATLIGSNAPDWDPSVGPELESLLGHKFGGDSAARDSARGATLNILQKCINPQDRNGPSNTGLIVGYVQSGKTLSFTAVAAAAQDNGFRTIIVIAGSSLNLADQNKDRLAADLRIGESFARPWHRRHNPSLTQLPELQAALSGWDRARGKTLLLTSLKHHQHVHNLRNLLEALGDVAAPVLIIDDEADQISLNTRVNQAEASANYSEILELRDRAPRHTYLQYTATPQANIFIPLWDRLSPDFCELLTPGSGYVGGQRLFVERRSDLVVTIPDADLDKADRLLEPPPSLHEAMRVFILGVAQGLADYYETGQTPAPPNRSMMVHPDRSRDSHQVFTRWIQSAKESWLRVLDTPVDPDRGSLVDQFRRSYDGLARTRRDCHLASFDKLLPLLPECLGRTQVREVNSRPGVDRTNWTAEWGQEYSWILVGGQNLDRGFTVEGLTVTYMPRNIGTGQADTIQQRARFFGYKAPYEDLCRVYVGGDVCSAFVAYVRHERSMRAWLERNKDRLADPSIPREFELDPSLRPTRPQVLVNNPKSYRFKQGWLSQQRTSDRLSRCRLNALLIDEFVRTHGEPIELDPAPWVADADRIRKDHRHRAVCSIRLQVLYQDLLASIVLPDAEEHTRWQVAMSMIANAIDEDRDLVGSIVMMRPQSNPFRSVDDHKRIKQLFAGPWPGEAPYAYRGDRSVHLDDVTLQLHRIDIGHGSDDDEATSRAVTHSDVAVVALWLGPRVNRPMIRQEQTSA